MYVRNEEFRRPCTRSSFAALPTWLGGAPESHGVVFCECIGVGSTKSGVFVLCCIVFASVGQAVQRSYTLQYIFAWTNSAPPMVAEKHRAVGIHGHACRAVLFLMRQT